MLNKMLRTNLALWHQGNDPLANSGILLPSNGAAVPTFYDRHGQVLNSTQGTAANQMSFVSSLPVIGNKPALSADGVNDYYDNAINIKSVAQSQITVFMGVVIRSSINTSNGVFGNHVSNQGRFLTANAVTGGAVVGRGATTGLLVLSAFTVDTPTIFTLQYDVGTPSNSFLWANGVLKSTFTEGTGNVGSTASYIGKIGATATDFGFIYLYALLIYFGILPTSQRQYIEAYINKLSS